MQLAIKKYEEAIENLEQSLDITLKAKVIFGLARLYLSVKNVSKAELLLNQTLEIQRKVLGENHLLTAITLNSLGELYYGNQEPNKAEVSFIQALEIHEKVLGVKHNSTINVLSNLGEVYRTQGDFDKAEVIFIQTLELRSKALGENHQLTAATKNNLGELYTNKGDFDKAESFLNQALESFRKTLGENSLATAAVLNNLAKLYKSKGEYEKAELIFNQLLEFTLKLGENHPRTISIKTSLAKLYVAKGEYQKAETFFIQALETASKTLGENHRTTLSIKGNLAETYRLKGEYEKAETLFTQALDVARKVEVRNPSFATALNNASLNYAAKGEYEKAIKYNKEANDLRELELSRSLTIGSERQKQLYLQKYVNETDITISLHVQLTPNSLLARQSALTQILRRKGRSIDAVNQSIVALRKRSSPEDVLLLDDLAKKKALLSNLIIQGVDKLTPEQYQVKLKVLEEEIDKLESQISQHSVEFLAQIQPINLENIQKAVSQDSTLVEFAAYNPYDVKTNKYGNPRYVVYLLNNQGEPEWVDLGETETIDKLVDELRLKLRNSSSNIKTEIKPLARKLDIIVMQPIRKLVGKDKRLLVAPDGKLNLLPFAALVDENDKFLVENTSISYLTSGRDLLRFQIKIENKTNPVIIGDPDFGKEITQKDVKKGSSIVLYQNFTSLPATELEAKAIKELFPESRLLLKKQATEEELNKVIAPLILHIATHGFFLPETKTKSASSFNESPSRIVKILSVNTEEEFLGKNIENPLLRSGIALAGANLRQTEEQEGIFTALKTTALNLWGTKVVTLSACDTGVGEVKTGEGIYGLRRALVLAGAETQLMSLWSVSDEGTKELMINYYSRLQKGDGRAKALRQVQLNLLKSSNRQHPFYWASFIQSGEWASLDGKH